ncbi:MAG: helix-turn-helix domain-containing protein, partial [Actinocrinis sp.]
DGRVYVALVARPHATSAEIAAESDLSPAAAARALGRLTQGGLVSRTGHPARYLAAEPDVALGYLINRQEARLGEARSLVHDLMRVHREAARIDRPDLAVEVLTGRDEISALVRTIQAEAKCQVRAFDRPPYLDRPGLSLPRQVEKMRQGVPHRVIYDRGALGWPGRLEQDIIPSLRGGERARVRTELPLKLVMADERVAVIPFSLAPRGEASAYVVHRSSLLSALGALFEAEWERAVPLSGILTPAPRRVAQRTQRNPAAKGPASQNPQMQDGAFEADQSAVSARANDAPDEETRSLLALLAAGLTDAAIARSLDWSERTTQRRIQKLMRTLGAATRFQASLLASRRGWL